MVRATVTLELAARRLWPVVVVGAGPAGSMAAHELARRGRPVLLLDKATFPRAKVCGCCLNGRAIGTLAAAGLGGLAGRLDAVPLTRLVLGVSGRRALLRLESRAAVSRERLDEALVEAAIAAGADFLPRARARLATWDEPCCSLAVSGAAATDCIRAKIVLAADGLAGGFLPASWPGAGGPVRRRSRIGAGIVLSSAPGWCQAGSVWMACGRAGYVGLVRLEDGRLDVAAALDPAAVGRAGDIGSLAARLVADAGFGPVTGVAEARWHGTPALTRRRTKVAAGRVLLLGDAAGYVEPFTGEGIAWALASGRAAAALVAEHGENAVRLWAGRYGRELRAHQRLCTLMAWALRRPRLVGLSVRLLSAAPWLAGPLVRHLNGA